MNAAENARAPRWTKAETRYARDQWIAGQRVALIARFLGRSRNSVISKANRLGWGLHANGQDYRSHA